MTKKELQEKLGKETKYSKWYLNIIFKAKLQNRKRVKKDNPNYIYYENHHILPKSIFPEYKNLSKNKWNGVLLTAKEHYIIHALIWKHYKCLQLKYQEAKMCYAFKCISIFEPFKDARCIKINSSIYNSLKEEISKEQSKRMKENNPFKGKKHSKESIEKAKITKKQNITLEVKEEISKEQSKRMKENNPMHNLSEQQMKERSEKISKSLQISRKNYKTNNEKNPNAKIIGIFNQNNELVYLFFGTFISYLKNNKSIIPSNALYESLNQHKKVFSASKRSMSIAKSRGFKDWIGMYVEELERVEI